MLLKEADTPMGEIWKLVLAIALFVARTLPWSFPFRVSGDGLQREKKKGASRLNSRYRESKAAGIYTSGE